MSTFGLSISTDIHRSAASGTISGPIHLVLAGAAFPSRDWEDFSVVLLSWWIPCLQNLLAGASEESLRFMEGNHRVVLARLARNNIELRGFRGRQEVHRCILDTQAIRVAETVMISAGQTLVQTCFSHGWQANTDVQALAEIVR